MSHIRSALRPILLILVQTLWPQRSRRRHFKNVPRWIPTTYRLSGVCDADERETPAIKFFRDIKADKTSYLIWSSLSAERVSYQPARGANPARGQRILLVSRVRFRLLRPAGPLSKPELNLVLIYRTPSLHRSFKREAPVSIRNLMHHRAASPEFIRDDATDYTENPPEQGLVVLKVARLTRAVYSGNPLDQMTCVPLFPYLLLLMGWACVRDGCSSGITKH